MEQAAYLRTLYTQCPVPPQHFAPANSQARCPADRSSQLNLYVCICLIACGLAHAHDGSAREAYNAVLAAALTARTPLHL
eukprot:1260342-Pleurochrysis_carterae.AAC.3